MNKRLAAAPARPGAACHRCPAPHHLRQDSERAARLAALPHPRRQPSTSGFDRLRRRTGGTRPGQRKSPSTGDAGTREGKGQGCLLQW
ncbi:hypothetical protein GCM10018793_57830 [Streptomyces sulfonofaciens]|uniref:Uncharacterized protein n=1 Tax=Streptomyces sulfonofaciens TaxID=68272 RepID=A0A919GLA8_9ACTN|nr:hypothetical protein GCM10018793_57830 [Streptomyces sulfonofaciens]